MNAVVNFTSYGDKSTARRGLIRKFPEYKDNVEQANAFLMQIDGKWGFHTDDKGLKIPTATNTSTPADLNVLNDMAPAVVAKPDAALAAAVEEDDHTPDAVGGAFGAFAMAQLTAPKAPEVTVPTVRTPVITKIEKNRPESNGVKRPSAGTICSQVWDIATGLSNANNELSTPTLSQVVEAAEKVGINKYTARTQYARWRVFHGITGRIVA